MQKQFSYLFQTPRNGYGRVAPATTFWFNVQRTDKCWIWTGTKHKLGYGQFCVGKKTWKTHRLSWLLNNGFLPETMDVLHTCDNPPCVNPEHLWIGTHSENMRDMIGKGRRVYAVGSKAPRAKLTEEGVLSIRKLYKRSNFTFADLADLFKVSRSTIQHILHRKTWKHIA